MKGVSETGSLFRALWEYNCNMSASQTDCIVLEIDSNVEENATIQNKTTFRSLGRLFGSRKRNNKAAAHDLNHAPLSTESGQNIVLRNNQDLANVRKYSLTRVVVHYLQARKWSKRVVPFEANPCCDLVSHSLECGQRRDSVIEPESDKVEPTNDGRYTEDNLPNGLHPVSQPVAIIDADSLKKYMEAKAFEMTLKAGEPKYKFIPSYMNVVKTLGLSPPVKKSQDDKLLLRIARLVSSKKVFPVLLFS